MKPKVILVLILVIVFSSIFVFQNSQIKILKQESKNKAQIETQLASVSAELRKLKETDQVKRNDELEAEIKNIEKSYTKSVTLYEQILDLKASFPKADKKLDEILAESIKFLAARNFASAEAKLTSLSTLIEAEKTKYVATLTPKDQPATQSNSAPDSGHSRQSVNTSAGSFIVNIIAADLGSTRVIIDTASDEDCSNNCPVLSLGDYAARSGAFAGVNGTYFCPADYPSCAGKTNTFDLLVMNKNKKYINSDNNVYSTNPAAIFGSGYARFVGAAQQWGRDTGVDGVISNFPLLVSGGNVVFGGDGDPKKGSRSSRQFVANKGSKIYIGSIGNATVAESALVLKALGMDSGLNLDSGGSSALWSQGRYIVGPGRNLPNSVLFVRK